LDQRLALPRRRVQYLHVLFRGSFRVLFDQRVVRQAEAAARKQIAAIAIVRKSPRLPHQPIDDVPVIHPMFAPATQPRQPLDQLLCVPNLHVIGVQPSLDPFANQPAGHRVGVGDDVDRAARIDPHLQSPARFQALTWQWPQQDQLFGEPRLPAGIALREQLMHKCRIDVLPGKIAAAP
jgi:hypothetical protein